MVDFEYLKKNYLNYGAGIMQCAYDIRNDFEKYSIADEMGDKKEAKQRWNDLYDNLVYLLAYFRIAGINFESPKFIADVYSTLEHLEKDEEYE